MENIFKKNREKDKRDENNEEKRKTVTGCKDRRAWLCASIYVLQCLSPGLPLHTPGSIITWRAFGGSNGDVNQSSSHQYRKIPLDYCNKDMTHRSQKTGKAHV